MLAMYNILILSVLLACSLTCTASESKNPKPSYKSSKKPQPESTTTKSILQLKEVPDLAKQDLFDDFDDDLSIHDEHDFAMPGNRITSDYSLYPEDSLDEFPYSDPVRMWRSLARFLEQQTDSLLQDDSKRKRRATKKSGKKYSKVSRNLLKLLQNGDMEDIDSQERPPKTLQIDGIDGKSKLLVPLPLVIADDESGKPKIKYSLPFPGESEEVSSIGAEDLVESALKVVNAHGDFIQSNNKPASRNAGDGKVTIGRKRTKGPKGYPKYNLDFDLDDIDDIIVLTKSPQRKAAKLPVKTTKKPPTTTTSSKKTNPTTKSTKRKMTSTEKPVNVDNTYHAKMALNRMAKDRRVPSFFNKHYRDEAVERFHYQLLRKEVPTTTESTTTSTTTQPTTTSAKPQNIPAPAAEPAARFRQRPGLIEFLASAKFQRTGKLAGDPTKVLYKIPASQQHLLRSDKGRLLLVPTEPPPPPRYYKQNVFNQDRDNWMEYFKSELRKPEGLGSNHGNFYYDEENRKLEDREVLDQGEDSKPVSGFLCSIIDTIHHYTCRPSFAEDKK